MKKDIIVAASLFLFVISASAVIKNMSNNTYAITTEDVDIDWNSSIDKVNALYNEEEVEEMLSTEYTLDEIYQSIFTLNNDGINHIDSEINNIYVNFYKYFSKEEMFYNMYGESYDYDEYNYLKKHHLMKDNDEMFGLYLTTYTKCEVFGLVDTDERNENLVEYCENR